MAEDRQLMVWLPCSITLGAMALTHFKETRPIILWGVGIVKLGYPFCFIQLHEGWYCGEALMKALYSSRSGHLHLWRLHWRHKKWNSMNKQQCFHLKKKKQHLTFHPWEYGTRDWETIVSISSSAVNFQESDLKQIILLWNLIYLPRVCRGSLVLLLMSFI